MLIHTNNTNYVLLYKASKMSHATETVTQLLLDRSSCGS